MSSFSDVKKRLKEFEYIIMMSISTGDVKLTEKVQKEIMIYFVTILTGSGFYMPGQIKELAEIVKQCIMLTNE